MRKTVIKTITVFVLFFVLTVSVLHLDKVCSETVGEAGKLVLAVDNFAFFH